MYTVKPIPKLWVLSGLADILTWSTSEELSQISRLIHKMDDNDICVGIMAATANLSETIKSDKFSKEIKLPLLWSKTFNKTSHEA